MCFFSSQFSGESAEKMKCAYGSFCCGHKESVTFYKDLLIKDRKFHNFVKVCKTDRKFHNFVKVCKTDKKFHNFVKVCKTDRKFHNFVKVCTSTVDRKFHNFLKLYCGGPPFKGIYF